MHIPIFPRNYTIQNKIAVSFTLLVVPAFLILNLLSYFSSIQILEDKVSASSMNTLKLINRNFDEKIDQVALFSDLIFANQEVQKALKKPIEQKNDVEKYNHLTSIMAVFDDFNYYNRGVNALLIIGENGENYKFKEAVGIKPDNYQESEWYTKAIEANGAINWMGIRKSQLESYSKASYVLSLSRVLKDFISNEVLGVYQMDFSLDALNEIFVDIHLAEKDSIFILDKSGNTITHSDKSRIGEAIQYNDTYLKKVFEKDKGYFNTKINDEKFLVTFVTSPKTGWKLIQTVPFSSLISEVEGIRNINISITVIILFCILFLSYLISIGIARPLKKLRKAMVSAEKGYLEVNLEVNSKDEVGYLGLAFNKMMKGIRELVERVRGEEQRKKAAELKALQNQINPHFIYNTLESIHMLAEIGGNREVSKMVSSLGKLMRYGINKDESLTTLQCEIEQISNYVLLMKYRFKDLFDVVYDIEENIYHTAIPRVSLQPILENCIYHGFASVRKKGTIRITGRAIAGKAVISVIDDGKGFDSSVMDILSNTAAVNLEPEGHRSIGLKNVNERIALYFGEQFGLTVYSRIDQGATVDISLPLNHVAK